MVAGSPAASTSVAVHVATPAATSPTKCVSPPSSSAVASATRWPGFGAAVSTTAPAPATAGSASRHTW